MRLPPGCGMLSGKIVRLLKCQYGMTQQAVRRWHLSLVRWLVEMTRMKQCKADPCIFRNVVHDKVSLMFGVHVDDIIVSGKSNAYHEFFSELKQRLPVKHQGGRRCTPTVHSNGIERTES